MTSALKYHPRWEYRPAWTVFTSRDEFGGDGTLLSLSAAHGVRERIEGEGRAASDDTSGYRVVKPGDVVINRLVARDGAIAVSETGGIISPAYWVLKVSRRADSRFLGYLLNSSPYLAEIGARSKFMPPAQFDLPWEQFRNLPIAYPDQRTQSAIADFLDTETTRIDALISYKSQLSMRMKERWASRLEARIGGSWARPFILDNERSGGIPQGWEVRKLLHLLDPSVPLVYGILLPGPRISDGVPYIGAGDVRPDRLRLDELPRTTAEIAAEYPRSQMRAGELVYAIRGSFGAIEQIPAELDGVNLSRDAARLAPARTVDGRWLMYALKSDLAQEQFRRKEVGAMVTGVNIGDLKGVRLPVPPIEIQREIVVQLDKEMSLTKDALERLADLAELLREHRQALITAAVTGEIEIPGVAA